MNLFSSLAHSYKASDITHEHKVLVCIQSYVLILNYKPHTNAIIVGEMG